ncbi:preprotein translocase subunit SecG [Chloroflexota bacterium]
METYFNIAILLVAVMLILILLFQVKGGGLGGIFGQAESTFRSRRGMEKTLLQVTVTLVIVFVVLSILSLQSWAQ